jgi:hypothetical protein
MIGTFLAGFIIGVIVMCIIQCIYVIRGTKDKYSDKENKLWVKKIL